MSRHAFNRDLTSGVTDLTQSITSKPFRLENLDTFSLQAEWTGAPVGEFKLQSSNDDGGQQDNTSIVNWTDVENSAVQLPNPAAPPITWNHRAAAFRWVRLLWTPNGGVGTLTGLRFTGKGAG